MRLRPSILTCAFVLVLAPIAAADTQPSESVDPGVSDVGPNSASLRQLGEGNGRFSVRQDITQRVPWTAVPTRQIDPRTGLLLPQPFEIRVPGVRAYVRSPVYVVRGANGNPSVNNPPARDGEYLQLPGPNTVYSLILPQPKVKRNKADRFSDWHDTRFSTRIDTRIGKQVSTLMDTQLHTRIDGHGQPHVEPIFAPPGTYAGKPSPAADPALQRLIRRLAKTPAKSDLRELRAPTTQPTPRDADIQIPSVHRAGDVPDSIRRQLHVVDQPNRPQAHGDQRDHAPGQ